jgi:predicted O-methyltransferase YrrM
VIETTLRTFHGVLTETDEMASTSETVDLVSMLVNFVKPAVVVEAGTYRGHLTLAVANVLRITEHGKIWSADTEDNFSPTLACIADQHPNIAERIVFYQGDFLDMLRDIPEVDFGYIDASSQENPHLRLDHANAVYDKLSPNGLIVVDDTASPDWGDARTFRQWADRDGLHLWANRGLTILQKRNQG